MSLSIVKNGVTFSRACTVDEVPSAGGVCVSFDDGMQVAVHKYRNTFYAISQSCPHQRYRVMSRCHVHDFLVTCPMHGWTFDLRTGEESRHRGRIQTFDVLVADDVIFVAYDPEALPSWMNSDSV